MNRYEMIYIIDADLEETARKELIEKVSALITNNGGEIEKVDETWGKRKLAYAIDYKTEGWYVLVNFKAPVELPRELERNLQINENVLRYLVINNIGVGWHALLQGIFLTQESNQGLLHCRWVL